MTLEELHELVSAMVEQSKAQVIPETLRLTMDLNPFDLHAFLIVSAHVKCIETPNYVARSSERGIVVVRRGSVSYTDGL